jgi:hypothetical protein
MQGIRRHLTYANVISTLCLFTLLGGTAFAAFTITSNSQVAPRTISGHNPPSGDHANIIGASVNGADIRDNSLTGSDVDESSLGTVPDAAKLGGINSARYLLTGRVKKLSYRDTAIVDPHPTPTSAGTIGPYTIKGTCEIDPSDDSVIVRLYANGPAGDFYVSDIANHRQAAGDSPYEVGRGRLTEGSNSEITEVTSTAPGSVPHSYADTAGTAMLVSRGAVFQVDFHAHVDAENAPSDPNTCTIYGTAIKPT